MDSIHFIEQFIVFIEDHLREDINFDEVLMDMDVESKSFLTLFNALVGMSPTDYQKRRQLSEIALKVYDGHRSLKDIIKYYNHKDLAKFKNDYQKEFGISVYDTDKYIDKISLQHRISFEINPTTKQEPFSEMRSLEGFRLIGVEEFFNMNDYNHKKKMRYLNYLLNSGIIAEILKHNNGSFKGLFIMERYSYGDIQVFVGTASDMNTPFNSTYIPAGDYQIFETDGKVSTEIKSLYEYIFRRWLVKENNDLDLTFSVELIKGLTHSIDDPSIIQVWQPYIE